MNVKLGKDKWDGLNVGRIFTYYVGEVWVWEQDLGGKRGGMGR